DAGGKVVFPGSMPLAYIRDSLGRVQGLDFTVPQNILGIRFPGTRLEEIGWYGAELTERGKLWGLQGWTVSLGWVAPDQVTTVLAEDENGMAAAWVKNYGGPEGSGLVQLSLPRGRQVDWHVLRNVAEYGLWR
ncbi:MAG TPA: hypothetical protein VMM37_01225, partial [Bacteroidota bacterium]|nr:hypothetical protein [Bacteroidota bacterium]